VTGPARREFASLAPQKAWPECFPANCADDKWKKTQKSSFRKPVLSPPLFPGVWEFNNGRLFGSQSKQSTHRRRRPSPYSSLTWLPWFWLTMQLILGSSSASRRLILSEMGYQFTLLVGDFPPRFLK
jgi:hypothetical protein